ncbi:hypothetical protein EBR96_03870, partial [bacterium]|nr:hypothetical protein [bacterium]
YIDTVPVDNTYYYSVFTKDGFGNYSAAVTTSIVIDTTPPLDPTDVRITSANATVVLRWINPISDFAAAKVLRKTGGYASGVTDPEATTVTENVTTRVTQNSLADGTYYYTVYARDAYGHYSEGVRASVTILQSIANGGNVDSRSVTLNETVSVNRIIVGDQNSNSVLDLASGAILRAGTTVLGQQSGSAGTIRILNGATWITNGQVIIGNQGNATLIQRGGIVQAAEFILAKESTSSANIQLESGTITAPYFSSGGGQVRFSISGGIFELNHADFDINQTGGVIRATSQNTNIVVSANLTQTGGTLDLVGGVGISGASVDTESADGRVRINSTDRAILTISGTLTAGGVLRFSLDDSITPKVGQSFYLISAESIVGTFSDIVSPTLGSGMRWDFSKLYTSGIVRIIGTADVPLLSSQPLVFPNPSSAVTGATIGYALARDSNIELRLYSAYGREIYRTTFKSGETGGTAGYNKVSVSPSAIGTTLDTGVYFYVLLYEGKVIGKGKMAVKP